jgi:hypothetical protein
MLIIISKKLFNEVFPVLNIYQNDSTTWNKHGVKLTLYKSIICISFDSEKKERWNGMQKQT